MTQYDTRYYPVLMQNQLFSTIFTRLLSNPYVNNVSPKQLHLIDLHTVHVLAPKSSQPTHLTPPKVAREPPKEATASDRKRLLSQTDEGRYFWNFTVFTFLVVDVEINLRRRLDLKCSCCYHNAVQRKLVDLQIFCKISPIKVLFYVHILFAIYECMPLLLWLNSVFWVIKQNNP